MNTVPPPRSGWLDDRLVVGRSRIQGRGLFARDFVPTGEVVVRLGGTLVTSLELRALLAAADSDPEASYVDTVTVEEDVHLVMPPGTTIHFANHCCDPSLWHVGPYEIATRRDLRNGDEATVDYATHTGAEGFVMRCDCGAPICRGQVTSQDWMLPELQDRYAGHWVPALQQRIERG